jgi:hypothetical protein
MNSTPLMALPKIVLGHAIVALGLAEKLCLIPSGAFGAPLSALKNRRQ